MSGFYNNWYKVNNPYSSNQIPQMLSACDQPPFYFGGSQVPSVLGSERHELRGGTLNKIDFLPNSKGKKKQSTIVNSNNIHIPRKLNIV